MSYKDVMLYVIQGLICDINQIIVHCNLQQPQPHVKLRYYANWQIFVV